jgi:serine acetyltransferase
MLKNDIRRTYDLAHGGRINKLLSCYRSPGVHAVITLRAKLFGKITVGNNVKIGANAIIYKDIPDTAIVVLDPGFKILSYEGNDSKECQDGV